MPIASLPALLAGPASREKGERARRFETHAGPLPVCPASMPYVSAPRPSSAVSAASCPACQIAARPGGARRGERSCISRNCIVGAATPCLPLALLPYIPPVIPRPPSCLSPSLPPSLTPFVAPFNPGSIAVFTRPPRAQDPPPVPAAARNSTSSIDGELTLPPCATTPISRQHSTAVFDKVGAQTPPSPAARPPNPTPSVPHLLASSNAGCPSPPLALRLSLQGQRTVSQAPSPALVPRRPTLI